MRDRARSIAEQIRVDEQAEIVEIFGMRFSADLFEGFSTETPHGQWFRVIKAENGCVHIYTRSDLIVPNTN